MSYGRRGENWSEHYDRRLVYKGIRGAKITMHDKRVSRNEMR